MSRETLEWLNTNTLIGFTDKRGTAWHYREGADNHFPGAVPVETVRERLFSWHAVQVPERWEYNGRTYESDRDAVVIRSDTGAKLGTFRRGYQPHQYDEWLIKNVASILDADLAIGSAGLLSGGGKAWVSVEVPDTVQGPGGVDFRPNLLATTSFDGSLSTTYKPVFTMVVCDNTLTMAMSEVGQTFKVKHSKRSLGKLTDAREALGIVHTMTDTFTDAVDTLLAVKVSDHAWERIVDSITPLPAPDAEKRAITMAENKRDKLWEFWTEDDRVAPWRGTGMGAWQAFNTYAHHESIVRNAVRPERNMRNAVDGTTEKADREVLSVIMALAA
jgi:phage/plasmid-like protein (TIGR03299 family)